MPEKMKDRAPLGVLCLIPLDQIAVLFGGAPLDTGFT